MSGMRHYPSAEIIIYRPTALTANYSWAIYLPEVSGQPSLLEGTGLDHEDAWIKASIARNYLQKYGRLPER
jgi:hypothetical protein